MNSVTEAPHIPETDAWRRAGIDGEAIRQAREVREMTKRDLAVACGVTAMTIHNWENDVHVPTKSVRLRVLEVLGLEVEPAGS